MLQVEKSGQEHNIRVVSNKTHLVEEGLQKLYLISIVECVVIRQYKSLPFSARRE